MGAWTHRAQHGLLLWAAALQELLAAVIRLLQAELGPDSWFLLATPIKNFTTKPASPGTGAMGWCCPNIGPPGLAWCSWASPLGEEITAICSGPFSHSKGTSAQPAMGTQRWRDVLAAHSSLVSHLSPLVSSGSSPQGGNVTPRIPPIPLARDAWLELPSSQEWCPWFCAPTGGMKASPARIEVSTGGLPDGSLPWLQGQRAKSSSVALTLLVGHGKRHGMNLWSRQAWRTMVMLFGQNGRLSRGQIWYLCLIKLYLIEKVTLLHYVGYLWSTRRPWHEWVSRKMSVLAYTCFSLVQKQPGNTLAENEMGSFWGCLYLLKSSRSNKRNTNDRYIIRASFYTTGQDFVNYPQISVPPLQLLFCLLQ